MVSTSRTARNPTRTDRPGSPAAHRASSDDISSEAADLTAEQAAERVARLLPEVYRRYHWANRVQGGDLPVTHRALEVLQHLSASGPLTVGELAVHLGLRRNSVSELLQRLEGKGLVARIRDERDERRVLVWLTEAGRNVVSRIGRPAAPDLIAQTMASLSKEDRELAVRGLELLASVGVTPNTAGGAASTAGVTPPTASELKKEKNR
jgi:DNA-binding MarR family transcriptional regulator